jgi:ADP-ribose pyrophosphatase YjhB (NUDIX family)
MTNELRKIIVTADPVIFRVGGDGLEFLVIKRNEQPFDQYLALPGTMYDPDKHVDLNEPVGCKLFEKTGIATFLEQVETVGGPDRDPRGWSISIVYLGLMRGGMDFTLEPDSIWVPVKDLENTTLAFDHKKLVRIALNRLCSKARYSAIPMALLPELFTMNEAKDVFELVLDSQIDLKSFSRRIDAANIVEFVGLRKTTGRGRPSEEYRLQPDGEMFFFERQIC